MCGSHSAHYVVRDCGSKQIRVWPLAKFECITPLQALRYVGGGGGFATGWPSLPLCAPPMLSAAARALSLEGEAAAERVKGIASGPYPTYNPYIPW